jgi:hypothetical protein
MSLRNTGCRGTLGLGRDARPCIMHKLFTGTAARSVISTFLLGLKRRAALYMCRSYSRLKNKHTVLLPFPFMGLSLDDEEKCMNLKETDAGAVIM